MNEAPDFQMVLVTQKRRRRQGSGAEKDPRPADVREARPVPTAQETGKPEASGRETHHHHRHYHDYGTVDLGELTPSHSQTDSTSPESAQARSAHEMDSIVLGRHFTGEKNPMRGRFIAILMAVAVVGLLLLVLLQGGSRSDPLPGKAETMPPAETMDLGDL